LGLREERTFFSEQEARLRAVPLIRSASFCRNSSKVFRSWWLSVGAYEQPSKVPIATYLTYSKIIIQIQRCRKKRKLITLLPRSVSDS
jgi:hypothetical protein